MTVSFDMQKFHNQKLAELPVEIRQKAVVVLKEFILPDDVGVLVNMYNTAPENWFAGHHLFYGMSLRNALRTAGLTDDMLPSGNWDDYYIPVLEIAIGVRPEPEVK